MSDVVADGDMQAPQAWTILRSTLAYVPGGVTSTTAPIQVRGPVQQASNHEILMLPEGDRQGSVRSFWATQPVYLTRSSGAAPSVAGEKFSGPGAVFTLLVAPPGGVLSLYRDGLLLRPQTDYVLAGTVITLAAPLGTEDVLWAQWPVTASVASGVSDILVYDGVQHRVLQVYWVPGSGYWKALATRMQAS